MEPAKSTEVLEHEHHYIKLVVAEVLRLIEKSDAGEELDKNELEQIADFLRSFVSSCHHAKEEEYLFPALERKGVPSTGCPIGALLHEHEKGRALTASLAEAMGMLESGDAKGKDAVRTACVGITELYPGHMWKEEFLLFPMTDKILSAGEQQELVEKFDLVEHAIGHPAHDRLTAFAERLGSAGPVNAFP